MKRALLLAVTLFMLSVAMYAQEDVTKFLGIPVDGTKSEMIQKLKEKGFVSNPLDKEVLEGEFNGTKVSVHVVTNNNKVCRIVVRDANTMSVGDIKIRFNKLCQQFQNNEKYISAQPSEQTISDEEDISYEMTVNHKRYNAAYYQLPAAIDTTAIFNEVRAELLEKYTEEQLANQTEDMKEEIRENLFEEIMDLYAMRPVWFMISELFGKYYITMFYDNEYNRANGEDL